MSVIRAFIAIEIAADVQQNIVQLVTVLKEKLHNVPVRWVPTENVHLTLKFLGDVSETNLEMLKRIIQKETAEQPPFEVAVAGLGAFPTNHRPRVIWVGMQAPPTLMNIQHGIENETNRLGYAREEREFSPHLTLGRVSRNASVSDIHKISEVLNLTEVGSLGVTRIKSVNLYRSDLKSSGAVYTCLNTALLNGKILER
jgi:2'-5' RNA ligase